MAESYFPECTITDNNGYMDFTWQMYFRGEQSTLAGAVIGPSSAVNGNVALFNGTTGKIISDGGTLGSAAFTDSTAYDVAGAATGAVIAHVAHGAGGAYVRV